MTIGNNYVLIFHVIVHKNKRKGFMLIIEPPVRSKQKVNAKNHK